jgi:lipopolysaccharide transport system ATP-binding protein
VTDGKFLRLQGVDVHIPVYNANSRSLKTALVRAATGAALSSRGGGPVLVKALQDVTFSAEEGDKIGIVGHNGAGKTTLLRVLVGAYIPSAGRVTSNGLITSLININFGFDMEETGRKNIFLRAAYMGENKTQTQEKLDEILRFADLGSFIDLPMRTYSTGMQLRLAFAVATSFTPEILLMDEWMSVGDEDFRVKAQKRLLELVDATKILIIASHSKETLEQHCNRIIWLRHGEVFLDGKPSEILTAYFAPKAT